MYCHDKTAYKGVHNNLVVQSQPYIYIYKYCYRWRQVPFVFIGVIISLIVSKRKKYVNYCFIYFVAFYGLTLLLRLTYFHVNKN